jgi:hypothetical protein
MQVQTRSQTKIQSQIQTKVQTRSQTKIQTRSQTKIQSQIQTNSQSQFNYVSWVIKTLKKYVNQSNELHDKIKKYKLKNKMSAYRDTHYEHVRLLTEMYYTITEYFPEVMNLKKYIYKDIQSLSNKIRKNYELLPTTKEEYLAVKVFMEVLQDVEEMVIPYLDDEDYVQENDEEDDDEEDDDEDYVYEDDKDDEEDLNLEEEIYGLIKNQNNKHIRFVYADDE